MLVKKVYNGRIWLCKYLCGERGGVGVVYILKYLIRCFLKVLFKIVISSKWFIGLVYNIYRIDCVLSCFDYINKGIGLVYKKK